MYSLFNTKTFWPVSPAPAKESSPVFFEEMSPFVMNDPQAVNQPFTQPVYYQVNPGWYAHVPNVVSRPRLLSDDVFLPEGAIAYEAPVFNYFMPMQGSQSQYMAAMAPAVSDNKICDDHDLTEHNVYAPPLSSNSVESTNGSYISPQLTNRRTRKTNSIDSLSMSSNSSSSSPTSNHHDDDSFLQSLFPSSLYKALNEDATDATSTTPLKTSSSFGQDDDDEASLLDARNLIRRRGRYITSSSSEKCPRFSENGVCFDLDECDKILMRTRQHDPADDVAKKREEFLLILEAERERQRKLVIPKRAPKMNCKFCKNNGESEEVYTKHRLHYNEKTVCPLLRHYVCRLCNSTGDFAHTIRHCPFNDKKDKIAWKATFLV